MADDGGLFGLAIAALVDVVVGETGKRKRWMRALNIVGALAFLLLVTGLVYITLKYS